MEKQWLLHAGFVLFAQVLPAQLLLAEETSGLEEIVVTATKRNESSQDVGISIVALSQDSLERQGFDSFTSFATSVPGMSFADRGPGQSVVTLRGVAQDPNASFCGSCIQSQETVGIYLDGTPVSLSGFNPEPRLFDVNRVEVLRGPQGTLFGSGSLSGTLRYISNEPNLDAVEGEASADYSHTRHGDDNYELNGMLNLPFADGRAALRVTTYGRQLGGYIDNVANAVDSRSPGFGEPIDEDVNEESTAGGRVQLAWQVSDELEAIARYYYQKSDLDGYPTSDTFIPTAFPGSGGNNPDDASLGKYQQSRLIAEGLRSSFSLTSLDLSYDLGFAQLTSESGFVKTDTHSRIEISDILNFVFGVPGVGGTTGADLHVKSFTQELRLASPGGGTFDWIVGAFYNDQDKDLNSIAPFPGLSAVWPADVFGPLPTTPTAFGPDALVYSPIVKDGRQWALFGEVGWRFAEQWRAIAGWRYYDYRQRNRSGPSFGLFASDVALDRELTESGVTPKFSLEYRPTDDWLVYATASEGFRLGGVDYPVASICNFQGDPEFSSDSLWNYELGSKATFQNKLQLNLSAYRIDWKDIPVSRSLPECGYTVTTTGRARVHGAEGDITYAATDDFQVSANFAYTKSEFTQAIPSLHVTPDSELPLVPEWTAGATAVYRFPVGTTLEGSISGSYTFRDKMFNVADPTLRQAQDSYRIAGLRLALDADKWTTALYVDNVFDEYAVTFLDTVLLNHARPSIIRPRTIGVHFGYHFQ